MIWIPSETNVLSVVIEPISNATSSVRSPPYNPSKWGHCPYLMPPTHINIYLLLTITVGFKVWTPLGVCEGLNCVHINTNISSALFHCVAICTDGADPLAWVKIVTPNCTSWHCRLHHHGLRGEGEKGGGRKKWTGWFWKMNGGWGGAGVGRTRPRRETQSSSSFASVAFNERRQGEVLEHTE